MQRSTHTYIHPYIYVYTHVYTCNTHIYTHKWSCHYMGGWPQVHMPGDVRGRKSKWKLLPKQKIFEPYRPSWLAPSTTIRILTKWKRTKSATPTLESYLVLRVNTHTHTHTHTLQVIWVCFWYWSKSFLSWNCRKRNQEYIADMVCIYIILNSLCLFLMYLKWTSYFLV